MENRQLEQIMLNINGRDIPLMVEKHWTLLYVLREILDLIGTKCGCNTGDCGACKVIIDGEAVNSCLIKATAAVGKTITTIEGVSNGRKLHPIQEAFIECGAVQCGYCTPGMIMSAKALLDKNLNPTEEQIREAFANNLCRCTGYIKIFEAVNLAAKNIREERDI